MLRRISKTISSLKPDGTRRRKQQSLQPAPAEVLEERVLPAGNVIATFRGGSLTLRGDNSSNNVEVIPTNVGFRVVGLPDGNGAATQVNNLPFQDFNGSQFVPKNVKASMKSGNDRVGVFVGVNGNVTASMGSGGDLFTLNTTVNASVPVGGNVKVNTGSSTGLLVDQVFIQNSLVNKGVNVKGSNGSQSVTIQNTQVNGKMTVNLGGGNDYLGLNNVAVGGLFKANGGGGNDVFEVPGTNPASKNFETII